MQDNKEEEEEEKETTTQFALMLHFNKKLLEQLNSLMEKVKNLESKNTKCTNN